MKGRDLKMSKIEFHTYDIFNIEDDSMRKKIFDSCHKKALRCGLRCRCIIDHDWKLELWGFKHQFVKYYLSTIFENVSKTDGIKRLVSFIFT